MESASGAVYHQPICDDVYLIGGNGVDSVYHFDFGARAVPDEVRQDIEGHLDELDSYEPLVKWVNIYGRFIAGSVRRDGRFDDFIPENIRRSIAGGEDVFAIAKF